MNIYIGNLSPDISDEDLKDAFSEYGHIKSTKVIKDNYTGKSKGFGFVEMFNDEEAKKAIDELDDAKFDGYKIKVSEAKPKTNKFKSRSNNRFDNNSFGSRTW